MSKKKHNKKTPKQQPRRAAKKLADFSLAQLATMPMSKVVNLMMDDKEYRAFAYPFSVICETHDFVDRYEKLQSKCLMNLMSDLKNAGIMDGTTFTMDRRATSVIKATAKTASFKQLDTYKARASEMYQKLLRAEELEEIALSQSDMDDSRKSTIRMVMLDAKKRMQTTFEFLVDEGEVTDND